MPLEHSSSSPALKRNIGTLMGEVGKSPHIQTRAQALAIAYDTQRRARAAGGVVPHYDIGGMVDPTQPQMPGPPGGMPAPQMLGSAPAGVAGPAMGPPPPQGMNNAPVPGSPQPPGQQWAAGVAQNAAPPAAPQNAPAMPPNAGPAQQPMGKQLMANGGALHRASGGMNMATGPNLSAPWQTKNEARQMRIGPILSAVPGRTDNHKSVVHSGSYILPAAHVSSIGSGNTNAGFAVLGHMFGTGPYGAGTMGMTRGRGVPPPPKMMKGLAAGGNAEGGDDHPDNFAPVDVDLSGGEYSLPPWVIIQKFGSLKRGHKILDDWVMSTRAKEIKTLRKLPPPAKG